MQKEMTQEEVLLGLKFLQNTVESDTDYEIFDVAIKSNLLGVKSPDG